MFMRVAKLYKFLKSGKRTLLEVSEHMEVSTKTATRYLKSAENAGWLMTNEEWPYKWWII